MCVYLRRNKQSEQNYKAQTTGKKSRMMNKWEYLTLHRMLKWVKGQLRKRTRKKMRAKGMNEKEREAEKDRGRRGAAPRGLYDSLSCCWLVRHWRGAGGGDSGEVCAFNYGLPIYTHCSHTHTHMHNQWTDVEIDRKRSNMLLFFCTHTHKQTSAILKNGLPMSKQKCVYTNTSCLHLTLWKTACSQTGLGLIISSY